MFLVLKQHFSRYLWESLEIPKISHRILKVKSIFIIKEKIVFALSFPFSFKSSVEFGQSYTK